MLTGPETLGVSFVVPVRDGARWIEEVLVAVLDQRDGRPFEVLVVDDGSGDTTPEILAHLAGAHPITVLAGEQRGAAAAVNLGILTAQHPIICQVDQDVVLAPGWLPAMLEALDCENVAAVQGYYATDRHAPLLARVMGYDLELRWDAIDGELTNHVTTGNTAYLADALHEVGLFDENLGYGYDNDMSYRLAAAGHLLAFCRAARSTHRWRSELWPYLRQQYGVGYGRLDVVRTHPPRFFGDKTSGPTMIAHVPLTLTAIAAAGAAGLLAVLGGPWRLPAVIAAVALAVVTGERLVAGLRAAVRFRDPAGLLFVPVHLLRNTAWCWATLTWCWRRLSGRPAEPAQSMKLR